MTRGRLAHWARLAVGPIAIAGFFLPWADGPGVFAGTQFTGFTLLGFAGRLHALDLSLAVGGGLWIARLAILGVLIAGAWQTLLAPMHRWHVGYSASGWYLAGFSAVACAAGLARSGVVLPPLGLGLVLGAAVLFLAGRWATPR